MLYQPGKVLVIWMRIEVIQPGSSVTWMSIEDIQTKIEGSVKRLQKPVTMFRNLNEDCEYTILEECSRTWIRLEVTLTFVEYCAS
jgi:hypothetical protein